MTNDISEILFTRTNDRIISDIREIFNSHEPQDIVEGLVDYCNMYGVELDDVIKLIKRTSDLKSILESHLISVRVINDDTIRNI